MLLKTDCSFATVQNINESVWWIFNLMPSIVSPKLQVHHRDARTAHHRWLCAHLHARRCHRNYPTEIQMDQIVPQSARPSIAEKYAHHVRCASNVLAEIVRCSSADIHQVSDSGASSLNIEKIIGTKAFSAQSSGRNASTWTRWRSCTRWCLWKRRPLPIKSRSTTKSCMAKSENSPNRISV